MFVDAFVAAFDAAVERLTVEIGDTFKRLNGRDFMAMNGCRFGCGDRGRGDPVVDVTSSFAPFNLNLTILSAPTKSRETCMKGDHVSLNKTGSPIENFRSRNTFLVSKRKQDVENQTNLYVDVSHVQIRQGMEQHQSEKSIFRKIHFHPWFFVYQRGKVEKAISLNIELIQLICSFV